MKILLSNASDVCVVDRQHSIGKYTETLHAISRETILIFVSIIFSFFFGRVFNQICNVLASFFLASGRTE